ncbi:hypothetical protein GXC69_12045, partial [Candidatus Macondimonas diazotrophica]|nr:hypothetical protein [Candidatus Macondimonas diazotrophica]
MALTEVYTLNAVTVGSTELSIVSGTTTLQSVTTDGFFGLVLDAATMTLGDEFRVRVYEKALSGSTQRVLFEVLLAHAQPTLLVTPMIPLLHGW